MTSASTLILGGLQASVNLTTGEVFLTPSANATPACALILAIPAYTGASFDAATSNWDGRTIVVAPALTHDIRPAGTVQTTYGDIYGVDNASLALDTGFDNIPAGGALQPSNGSETVSPSAGNTFVTGSWRISTNANALLNTGDVSILTEAEAISRGLHTNAFPGATSGNLLCITLGTDEGVALQSFNITPIAPGEIYGISMNATTGIDSGGAQVDDYADSVALIGFANTNPGFGVLNSIAYLNATATEDPGLGIENGVSVPTDKVWRKIYWELATTDLEANRSETPIGGSGTVDFMGLGMRLDIRFTTFGSVPADYSWYVDNIYVYCKGVSDLNFFDANDADGSSESTGTSELPENGLAPAVTAFTMYNPQNPGSNGTTVDGGFNDTSTGLATANNWVNPDSGAGLIVQNTAGVPNTDFNVVHEVIASLGRHGSGAFHAQLTDAAGRSADVLNPENHGFRVRTRGVAVDGLDTTGAAISGAPDISGEGLFGVSFWVKSSAVSIVDLPQVKVALTDLRPTQNQMIMSTLLDPSALPTVDQGWHQYYLIASYPKITSLKGGNRMTVSMEPLAMTAKKTSIDVAFGAYSGNNRPGFDGDASIYLDDVQVHRLGNNDEYYNHSLFDTP
jgi:hypothetical protein